MSQKEKINYFDDAIFRGKKKKLEFQLIINV